MRLITPFTLCMLGNFSELTFSKNPFWNYIRLSNNVDPDEDPDVGPNCLQRLSADGKSCCLHGKS